MIALFICALESNRVPSARLQSNSTDHVLTSWLYSRTFTAMIPSLRALVLPRRRISLEILRSRCVSAFTLVLLLGRFTDSLLEQPHLSAPSNLCYPCSDGRINSRAVVIDFQRARHAQRQLVGPDNVCKLKKSVKIRRLLKLRLSLPILQHQPVRLPIYIFTHPSRLMRVLIPP